MPAILLTLSSPKKHEPGNGIWIVTNQIKALGIEINAWPVLKIVEFLALLSTDIMLILAENTDSPSSLYGTSRSL